MPMASTRKMTTHYVTPTLTVLVTTIWPEKSPPRATSTWAYGNPEPRTPFPTISEDFVPIQTININSFTARCNAWLEDNAMACAVDGYTTVNNVITDIISGHLRTCLVTYDEKAREASNDEEEVCAAFCASEFSSDRGVPTSLGHRSGKSLAEIDKQKIRIQVSHETFRIDSQTQQDYWVAYIPGVFDKSSSTTPESESYNEKALTLTDMDELGAQVLYFEMP